MDDGLLPSIVCIVLICLSANELNSTYRERLFIARLWLIFSTIGLLWFNQGFAFLLAAFLLSQLVSMVHLSFLEPFFTPFYWLIHCVTRLYPWQNSEDLQPVSEQDIRDLIEEGDLNEPQKELIENVFELDDVTIEEICTHRSDVAVLSIEDDLETWTKTIHEKRHTYFPVCGEDEDDVIGVLDARDFFSLKEPTDQKEVLAHCSQPPIFEVESMKVDQLLRIMITKKAYFIIVMDEYGGMSGVVTLHDVMEALVGDIQEEDDASPEAITKLDDNTWRIYGFADLDDVHDALHLDFDDLDNETFNGYILSQTGHVPEDGAKFTVHLEHMIIRVREVINHRIGMCVVTPIFQEVEDGTTQKGNNRTR